MVPRVALVYRGCPKMYETQGKKRPLKSVALAVQQQQQQLQHQRISGDQWRPISNTDERRKNKQQCKTWQVTKS